MKVVDSSFRVFGVFRGSSPNIAREVTHSRLPTKKGRAAALPLLSVLK